MQLCAFAHAKQALFTLGVKIGIARLVGFKTDVDSFNDAHADAPIEVDWDFTMDLLELEAAAEIEDEAEAA